LAAKKREKKWLSKNKNESQIKWKKKTVKKEEHEKKDEKIIGRRKGKQI